jgi:protoporphyrinogen/coproporphyrinogen III oxidase
MTGRAPQCRQGGWSRRADVVIVGAGLAGMVAAYELRDRDIVVFEAADRVGGRTMSGSHGEYWYNLGAQFIWDQRTIGICRELGLGLLPGDGARASLFVHGKLVSGATPYQLFFRLPMSVAERTDLARTVLRLRRLSRSLPTPAGRAYDAASLLDLIQRSGPLTQRIINMVAVSGTGLRASEISGWIGLSYAIHLFGGNVNDTLKQVVGGTQGITAALREAVGVDRVVLGAGVTRVVHDDQGVVVSYTQHGTAAEISARACVVAVPAHRAAAIVDGLPSAKLRALKEMTPYAPIVVSAWLTGERAPMPWDDLLVVPVADELSFEQVINNSFFIRRGHGGGRHDAGTLVTLSTASLAESLTGLPDAEVRRRVGADLEHMFPAAREVLRDADVRVARWSGLPPFRVGWLGHRDDLRSPVGPVHFCGDYTAQPGTPGAVGSGHHAAVAVRHLLDARQSTVAEPQPGEAREIAPTTPRRRSKAGG